MDEKVKRYGLWTLVAVTIWIAVGVWNTPTQNGRPIILTLEDRLISDYIKKADTVLESLQVLDAEDSKSISPTKAVVIAVEQQEKMNTLLAQVEEISPPQKLAATHSQLKDLIKTRLEYTQAVIDAYSKNDADKFKQKLALKQSYMRKTDAFLESIRRNRAG